MYHYKSAKSFTEWQNCLVLGEYYRFDEKKHWIVGAEIRPKSITKDSGLAYNFYEDINHFRYNHPYKTDECDFVWDYYNPNWFDKIVYPTNPPKEK